MSEYERIDVREDLGYGPSNEETNRKLRELRAKQQAATPNHEIQDEEEDVVPSPNGAKWVRAQMKIRRGEELTEEEKKIVEEWPEVQD